METGRHRDTPGCWPSQTKGLLKVRNLREIRLAPGLAALLVLSAAMLAFHQPSSTAAVADINRIAIDTDITGNTVTPCTATGDPNVDYPCNNSTVLGPTDNCRAIAVGQSIQIDVIGDSIPAGGTNNSDLSGAGVGQSDMALDWSPNGPTGPIAVTGKDTSVALVHQGLNDNPFGSFDGVTGAASTSGHWKWTDVDVNTGVVGEGGQGIAIRLTIKGLNAGTAVLNLATNLASQPTWTDVHGNEYSVGQNDGATIIVGGGTCGTGAPTAATTPAPSGQTPTLATSPTPTPVGQTPSRTPLRPPPSPSPKTAATQASSGSSVPWIPLAAVSAGIIAVLGGGLWYARGRWLR